MKHTFTALALVVSTAMACATNPATGKRQFNILSEGSEVSPPAVGTRLRVVVGG